MDGKLVLINLIEFNYSKSIYILVYLFLFFGKGINIIVYLFFFSCEDYVRGYCLYMFDVNSIYDSENNLFFLRKGYIRL